MDSFVCYYADKPVGRADLLIHQEWAMIEDLVVVPWLQRQGFGTVILRTLIEEAISCGVQNIVIVADLDDTPKEMYQRLALSLVVIGLVMGIVGFVGVAAVQTSALASI